MASWAELEAAEPDFAALVRGLLDAHVHKTLATLRRDGAPRISGTEITIDGGELWFGSMAQARKARDLQRDPRFALHSGSDDPPGWKGDAKLSGRAVEVAERGEDLPPAIGKAMSGQSGAHLFRADLEDVSVVRLTEAGDELVIEHWQPGRGLTRTQRR